MIPILGKEDIVEYIENLRNRIRKEKKLQTGDEISKEDFIRLYKLYGTDLAERIFARYVLDIGYTSYANLISNNQNITRIFGREKYSSKYISDLKQEIVSQNELHINDLIDYQDFVRIYNSSEHKLDMATFASKVLDINYNTLCQLRAEHNKKCKVLRRTKFSNTQVLELRKLLREKENIDSNSQITYDTILELYKKYGGILKENDFVRKVLEIPKHTHNIARKNPQKMLTIQYKENLYLEEKLSEVRLQIAKEYGLHVDDEISWDLFLQIYEQYKEEFTIKRFASDIFGIPISSLENMQKNKSKTRIFEQESLTENEIIDLRDRILREENLHSEDKIDYITFMHLYNKYGGILSAQQFAEYVLEIQPTAFNNLKTVKVVILKDELPDFKELIDITNKVMEEYNLRIRQKIDYALIIDMYSKYGRNMSIKRFEEDVLDIYVKDGKLDLQDSDNNKNKMIMISTIIPDEYIQKLRNRVIVENTLQINANITKEEFERIFKNYNGRLEKAIFAEKILDISDSALSQLLTGTHKTTVILSKETIDHILIKDLRNQMIQESNLHIKDFIDYKQFKILYEKYSEFLNERDFALLMLDINKSNFYNIKYTSNAKTRILIDETISPEWIENSIYFFKQFEGKLIDYEKFKELYNQYGGRIDEFLFCEQILGFKLNFIKYYKVKATIKDPIAKEKALKIREKFAVEKCRFLDESEVEKICTEYDISIDDFLKYVVLKYNFQFYPETKQAYEHNKGIWYGGKKIRLSSGFVNEHAEKLVNMSETAIRTLVKGDRISKEVAKDISSEVLISAIENYGELEGNFGYDYDELCKRIYIRMRNEANRKLVSHWKVSNRNVSGKFYYKEKRGPDIQIGESKECRKVENEAIENVDKTSEKNKNKILIAIKKLSELGSSNEKISEVLTDYLGIDKIELIKILKSFRENDTEVIKRDLQELSFAKKIIEEYKKHGVDIDYEKVLLVFYINKISQNDIEYSEVIDGILITCENCISANKSWEDIKQELVEKQVDLSTIAIASSVYNSNVNIIKERTSE